MLKLRDATLVQIAISETDAWGEGGEKGGKSYFLGLKSILVANAKQCKGVTG